MKKFLEVLMDDNGELHFSTDFEFADSVERPVRDMKEFEKIFDQINRRAIRGVVNAVWNEKNLDIAKAIRYLSMAEIITCAEPYEGVEQLWDSMMFYYVPHYERYSDQLKVPYGYDPSKTIRPLAMDSRQGIVSLPFKMPGMN
jgi:hypothetical protein